MMKFQSTLNTITCVVNALQYDKSVFADCAFELHDSKIISLTPNIIPFEKNSKLPIDVKCLVDTTTSMIYSEAESIELSCKAIEKLYPYVSNR